MATAAGYVLSDGYRIWGIGETLHKARCDARNEGAYLDHDGEELDDWIDYLRVMPATAALMAAARQDRWTSYRRLSGGVWGTPAEYEAEQ
jgi:hypothetical protein